MGHQYGTFDCCSTDSLGELAIASTDVLGELAIEVTFLTEAYVAFVFLHSVRFYAS